MLIGNEYNEKISNHQKITRKKILFLVLTQLLDVYGMLHLESLEHRRLIVLLTSAEFFHNACLFKLSLELLQSSFDVLAVLNWYYNHAIDIII